MTINNRIFKPISRGLLAVAVGISGLVSAAHAADKMQMKTVSMTSLAAPSADTTLLEGINFSGLATIKSRLSSYPEGDSKLVVSIDLGSVAATGTKSAAKYALWSQDVLILPLAASHQIEIQFPYSKNANDQVAKVRTGVARFALNVDTATGAITSASGTISSR